MDHALYNVWRIHFQQNVHMYCHHLTATKGDVCLEISCEDTPSGFVGIWPYSLQVDAPIYEDLLVALHAWADDIGLNYRIYVTNDKVEPS